jgi:cellulose synthase/poly-beta-1,6-N-acetylglucosamine synthase-like glycosyltransferase
LVVADNRTDRTAAVAAAAGAEVAERADPVRRGKGYALDFGVRRLEADPPEGVVVVDADTTLQPGALERLACEAAATGRPVQAINLLEGGPDASLKARLSAFAFRLKNLVRPLGLDRLGLPCLLTGTGMAFPWPMIRDARLASGNLVEDMQLGLDLAVAGHPPCVCPEAEVIGELPPARAALTQRTPWEHGHLQTLLGQAPRLVAAAFRLRRPGLLGLALEVCVPPLSLLLLLWAAALGAALLGWAAGASPGPALALAVAGGIALAALFVAWFAFGRRGLPFWSLLAAPFYMIWKLPIYLTFLFRPQQAWVRTERAAPR